MFLGYNGKRDDGRYVKGTAMLNPRLNSWVAAAVRCLRKENTWGSPTEIVSGCECKIVEAATSQIYGDFGEFAKHWY